MLAVSVTPFLLPLHVVWLWIHAEVVTTVLTARLAYEVLTFLIYTNSKLVLAKTIKKVMRYLP